MPENTSSQIVTVPLPIPVCSTARPVSLTRQQPIDGAIDLGCWTDRKNDRIMTLMTTSKSMTHEYCRDWCAEQQTEDFVPKFFGVEFGREV